jgi:glycosyltransferase involved in cell wall biosynthesis
MESVTERTAAALERARRERALRPTVADPLVSVRIATFNRPRLLVERAIASVLRQTYQNFEIVVVGDHANPETEAAVRAVGDPRIRYVNLPYRPAYPIDPNAFWQVAGTRAANVGLALCRGEWIAPLDDDDEFTPEHLEVLLQACRANDWEFCYSSMEMEVEPGRWKITGSWPLRHGHICHASLMYSSALKFLRYDIDAWRTNEPGDWNLWRRMRDAGVRVGFVEQVLGRHYVEHTATVT